MKYMRDELVDSYQILELQDKILEIAKYISDFCDEYNIDYSLMGGSALGAKRHGGFIPWDDDLDIFMTPDDYERFREYFRKNGDKDKYYLQEWGLTDGLITTAKVRMNGTAYIESDFRNWNMHQGIYVDIFILHTCPDHRVEQLWQCMWAKYVIMKGLVLRGYNRRGGAIKMILKIMSLFPNKFLVKFGLKQVYRWRNKTTKYYCNFLGKAVFKKGIYKREYFTSTEYMSFEKIKLRVPKKIHEFLTDRFGDYMILPSAERIKWEQHAEEWNASVDFHELLPHITNFEDESKLI